VAGLGLGVARVELGQVVVVVGVGLQVRWWPGGLKLLGGRELGESKAAACRSERGENRAGARAGAAVWAGRARCASGQAGDEERCGRSTSRRGTERAALTRRWAGPALAGARL
jgi:hypothetical protein